MWLRKQSITIDNTDVPSALVDFPLLITLDHLDSEIVDLGSNSAKIDGDDIKFTTDSDGLNRISCDIVAFVANATPANRECQVWVKVPNVSNTVDTVIYIWYNNSSATQPAPDAAFGSESVWTGYTFVSHDGFTDASGNLTVTQTVPASSAASVFDGTTADFNGTDDHHKVDMSTINIESGLSVSFWCNFNTLLNFKRIIHITRDGQGMIQFVKGDNSDTEGIIFGAIATSGFNIPIPQTKKAVITPQGNWNHVYGWSADLTDADTLTVNDTDYSLLNSGSALSFGLVDDNMVIGARANNSAFYEGLLAEIRVSTTNFSDGYKSAAFTNQSTPATFATAGTPEVGESGGALSLEGAITTGSTVTGDISLKASLSGNINTGSSVVGNATVKVTMQSDLNTGSSVTGNATLKASIGSDIVTSSTVVGNLIVTSTNTQLSGDIVTGSLVVGNLSARKSIDSSIITGSTVTGSLTEKVAGSGDIVTSSTVTGNLTFASTNLQLAGDIVTGSLVTGDISAKALLEGHIVTGSTVSGTFSVNLPYSETVEGESNIRKNVNFVSSIRSTINFKSNIYG